MKRLRKEGQNKLVSVTEIPVRFNEVDSLRVVWHGNYIKYFEDGREAFGEKYDLNYLDFYEKEGFVIPIIKMSCEHKKPLRYGEKAIIETSFVNTEAAKIIFNYKIYRNTDKQLVAIGETVQVFLDGKGELHLIAPLFFNEWKKRWGLL